jgi:transcription initiation factor TFIIIB Brf1 subunit/transcription initiation factor TFIIB
MGFALGDSDDESLRALDCILEAWEAGATSGVRPEFMAYAAIYTALSDLVAAYGEEAVADLAGRLVERVRSGEFTLYRVQQ